jgi:hypothetical protein
MKFHDFRGWNLLGLPFLEMPKFWESVPCQQEEQKQRKQLEALRTNWKYNININSQKRHASVRKASGNNNKPKI